MKILAKRPGGGGLPSGELQEPERGNTLKMWSGRFREPLDAAFEQWQRSFPFDWRLLPQEIAASSAHARTLAAAGILTPAELDRMLSGLAAVAKRPDAWATRISMD